MASGDFGPVVVSLMRCWSRARSRSPPPKSTTRAPGDRWEKRAPDAVGMDPDKLAEAVKFAQTHEAEWLRDMRAQIERDVANEPYSQSAGRDQRARRTGRDYRASRIHRRRVGRHRPRGHELQRGEELSVDARRPGGGSRTDQGRATIRYGNTCTTAASTVRTTPASPGTCCSTRPANGKACCGASPTSQIVGGVTTASCRSRARFWEYNDVRVNRLALSLLRVWNKPLPQVLQGTRSWIRSAPATPGSGTATATRSSRSTDAPVQSVSGGSHWGGGLWASARDHARFGYCFCAKATGTVGSVVSERWVRMATHAHRYRSALWLSVVAEHRAQDPRRAATGVELLRARVGRQRDLDRSGPRPGRRDALAGLRRAGWVCEARDGGGEAVRREP